MSRYTYKIVYNGSSKVIKRIVEKLNNWSEVMLGTTHSTAFYGDLGQSAYEHSQLTSGNPHNVTLEDLGIPDAARQLEAISDILGSDYDWVTETDNDVIGDHNGDTYIISTAANLLAFH